MARVYEEYMFYYAVAVPVVFAEIHFFVHLIYGFDDHCSNKLVVAIAVVASIVG